MRTRTEFSSRPETPESRPRPDADIAALIETDEKDGYNEQEAEPVVKAEVDEEKPYEEGYGIGDEEPAGTNSYDVTDEWN